MGICHCTDCQALSASAYRVIAIIPGESFRITRGSPRTYVKVGDGGNRRVQAFCATCGSGIYASEDNDTPADFNVRVGAMYQRWDITPVFECWRQSALPWIGDTRITRKFDANPA